MTRGLAAAIALALAGAPAPITAGGMPEAWRAPATGVGASPQPAASPERIPAFEPPPPAAVDPAARLPSGDDAAEHWDLAAHFESGHRLYLRFLITNAGPGERSAAAFGHWIAPDGAVREFRNGRLSGRWQLSDDGREIRIGSSQLAFRDGERHFEVDNDKRGIKIRLDFGDDGSAQPGPARPGGYRVDLLNLATPGAGSFWLEGMSEPRPLRGRVLLTHTWFPGPENRQVLRRIDVASLAPGPPGPRLFLSRVEPPQGAAWHWVVVGNEAGVETVSDVVLEPEERPGRSDYPIPSRIELRGKRLSGSIRLGRTRLEVDPLDALPALVRMVYSFGGRPRHLWVDSIAEVVLKSPSRDAVLRFEGAGIATLFFVDVFPPSQR